MENFTDSGQIPFEGEILANACYFGLKPSLVAAIVAVESSFRPWAHRYEPGFKRRYVSPWLRRRKIRANVLETALLSSSLGLMQVMGLVACELGLPPKRVTELFVPRGGLWFGCRKLRQLMKRYKGCTEDVISAYNQGNRRFLDLDGDGLKDPGEPYRNQAYVDKVLSQMKRFSHLDRRFERKV